MVKFRKVALAAEKATREACAKQGKDFGKTPLDFRAMRLLDEIETRKATMQEAKKIIEDLCSRYGHPQTPVNNSPT